MEWTCKNSECCGEEGLHLHTVLFYASQIINIHLLASPIEMQ